MNPPVMLAKPIIVSSMYNDCKSKYFGYLYQSVKECNFFVYLLVRALGATSKKFWVVPTTKCPPPLLWSNYHFLWIRKNI